MSTVRIEGVRLLNGDDPEVASLAIEPAPATEFAGHSITISGRVVLKSSPLEAVQIELERAGADPTPIADLGARGRPSEDGDPGPRRFRGSLSTLGFGRRFDLTVVAVAASGRRLPLATITGEREPLNRTFEPALNPIMLMSHGRSGSTWVTHLLGSHPRIVTYKPFDFEPRVGNYWLGVLETLADPASYTQAIDPKLTRDRWWTGAQRTIPAVHPRRDPDTIGWLAGEAVEELAAFCQERIERFYGRVAAGAGKPAARYFAERSLTPDWFTTPLYRELYAGAREVYLVRDFRDVVCSRVSFGAAQLRRDVAEGDLETTRRIVAERASEMLAAWRARWEHSFLLRYEDVVLAPESTLKALFDFLEIESDPEAVRETLATAERANAERQESHRTAESVEASIGRWRHELDAEAQDACNEAFGEALREFEYEA